MKRRTQKFSPRIFWREQNFSSIYLLHFFDCGGFIGIKIVMIWFTYELFFITIMKQIDGEARVPKESHHPQRQCRET
jgi:hypothetical protein